MELDFEKDLKDVLSKHGWSTDLAAYIIRDIDNLRETWPKASVLNDRIQDESTVAGTSQESGND